MNMNAGWQELYRAAMLELRPDELRRRIDDAEKAIQQRILELTQNDSSSKEERRAIEDALRGRETLGRQRESCQQLMLGPPCRRLIRKVSLFPQQRSNRIHNTVDIRFRARAADANLAGLLRQLF